MTVRTSYLLAFCYFKFKLEKKKEFFFLAQYPMENMYYIFITPIYKREVWICKFKKLLGLKLFH